MSASIDVALDNDVALINIRNDPANALSIEMRQRVQDTVSRLLDDNDVRGIVVHGYGGKFVGGADIKEFDSGAAGLSLRDLGLVFDAAKKPIVAAIEGYCLGGGLELALICHYRISEIGSKLGFPEVKVGVFPGGSGTQRAPRLIGLEPALDLVTSGRIISAKAALDLGLIDKLVQENVIQEAVAAARTLADTGESSRSSEPLEGIGRTEEHVKIVEDYRNKFARRALQPEAVRAAIDSVDAGLDLEFTAALNRDREAFDALKKNSDQGRALRHLFFAERSVRKLPPQEASSEASKIESVGIIGAGTMGGGIALACLKTGHEVAICDISETALSDAKARIEKTLSRLVSRGRLTDAAAAGMVSRLRLVTALDDLAMVDLVVEAAAERMEVKKAIFRTLDEVCKPGCILSSNTSSLDIDEIAEATSQPDKVIGLHFFSPADVMPLLEVVRGAKSSPGSMKTAMAFAKVIGKTAVPVGVCPGFAANRSRTPMTTEAYLLVEEGASPSEVDKALRDMGMPMGPCEVADLAGLDIGFSVRNAARDAGQWVGEYPEFADQLVHANRLGRKSGSGWYRYAPSERKPLQDDPEFDSLLANFRKANGITPRQISQDEIRERCLFAAINESAKILHEGVIAKASDMDVIWVNGFGFPRELGGILHYAETVGLSHVAARVSEFHDRFGERWTPSQLLLDCAAGDGHF